jgi:hypothetical protein
MGSHEPVEKGIRPLLFLNVFGFRKVIMRNYRSKESEERVLKALNDGSVQLASEWLL